MTPRPHPFADPLGFRVVQRGKGRARHALEATQRPLNPNGVAHGAVLYALADTAIGGALDPTLPYGASQPVQGVYLAPACPGPPEAEARLLHRAGRPAVPEAGVSQGSQPLARMMGTCVVLRRAETGP